MPRYKLGKDKRSVVKTVRFTEQEWSSIEGKMADYEMGFTDFARDVLLMVARSAGKLKLDGEWDGETPIVTMPGQERQLRATLRAEYMLEEVLATITAPDRFERVRKRVDEKTDDALEIGHLLSPEYFDD